MDQPLLLIDIDGVISLFGFDAARPPAGRLELVDGVPHFLSTTAAQLLEGLSRQFELVWCSGWEERADQSLPSVLGLPAGLHHLTFADAGDSAGRHWKLAAIDGYAGCDRSVAWIDDGFDESCHAWAAARPGPTLLLATDPAIGLTSEHARRLRDWASGLSRR